MTLKTRAVGPWPFLPAAGAAHFPVRSLPGCSRSWNSLSCTDRYIEEGKNFSLKNLIAGNFPHFFFHSFVTDYFPGPVWFGLSFSNSFDWKKNYRLTFDAIQSGAANTKRKNSFAFSELVDD